MHRMTYPHTSDQNGAMESRHKRIIEMSSALLSATSIPLIFWSYAVRTATFLLNHIPSKCCQGCHLLNYCWASHHPMMSLKLLGVNVFPICVHTT